MSLVKFITLCFNKREDKKMKQIRTDMFRETNLYREMLGLSQLKSDKNLDQLSADFCKHMFGKFFFEHHFLDRSYLETSPEDVNIRKNTKEMEKNIHVIDNSSHSKAGLYVIQKWQLCDANNKILTCPSFQAIGLGAEMGPTSTHMNKKKENGRSKPPKHSLYLTQYFMPSVQEVTILSKIKITPVIIEHLRRYVKYFCNDLNNFINEERYYQVGDNSVKKINNSAFLNRIARQQLIYSTYQDGIDEDIQDTYKKIIQEKKPKYSNVYTKIVRKTSYIPSCRLVNEKDLLSDEIISKLRSGVFNRFGMNVSLFEDKTFRISIVFTKVN
ncbi:hypothetical protein CDIK_2374 [Cucumispora dikerogammari]|nr:hypothetical protein CDIK_2374 [Cucumispora dikerogammari]